MKLQYFLIIKLTYILLEFNNNLYFILNFYSQDIRRQGKNLPCFEKLGKFLTTWGFVVTGVIYKEQIRGFICKWII